MIDYEYIDRYINKELSNEESARFEEQLKTDAGFAEAYQLYSSIQDTMQADTASGEAAFREKLQPLREKYFTPETKKNNGKLKKLIYWTVAAAAVVILVFTLVPINQGTAKSADALYAQYAKLDKPDETIRGSQSDSVFGKAAALFNDRSYKEAIPYFEKIKSEKSQAGFWLGVCYIETGDYVAAISNFDLLINGTSDYQPKAQFFKALVYLKQNNKEACRQQLMQIPQASPYSDKAKELLKEL